MLTACVLGAEMNLALNKPAYQSSTDQGGDPERAVGMNVTHVFMRFSHKNILPSCP